MDDVNEIVSIIAFIPFRKSSFCNFITSSFSILYKQALKPGLIQLGENILSVLELDYNQISYYNFRVKRFTLKTILRE